MAGKLTFKKATKTKKKARWANIGPSGSGKTFTSLQQAIELAGPDGRVALIDSERGSATLYSDIFDFDHLELESFHPQQYMDALDAAADAGYAAVVIDSLSHAWMGKDGVLELVDRTKGSSFSNGWREMTPLHNRLVDSLLSTPFHLIVTLRSKVEYVVEETIDDRGKKKSVPRKIGMQPIQREGLDFEFDVVADMDHGNTMTIGKTRCHLLKGRAWTQDGVTPARILRDWLAEGADAPPPPPPPSSDPFEDGTDMSKRACALRDKISAAMNGADMKAASAAVESAKMPQPYYGALEAVYKQRKKELIAVARQQQETGPAEKKAEETTPAEPTAQGAAS